VRRTPDYSVYLVTDRALAGPRSVEEVVALAVEGGATIVQLREKSGSSRQLLSEARRLKELLDRVGRPLVINDRLDIALASGAAGVHLGQDDLSCAEARRIAGPDLWIGVSVATVEEAIAAERDGADYLGVGPIYPTPTKADAGPAIGLEGLRQIRAAVHLPLVAIGGIHAGNAAEVIRAGADGVAVVSAIMAADDPRAAAAALLKAVMAARPLPHRWA